MTSLQQASNDSSFPSHQPSIREEPVDKRQQSLWIYDRQARLLLEKAHEQAVTKQNQEDAEANRLYPVVRTYGDEQDYFGNYYDSYDHDSDHDDQPPSPSEEDESEEVGGGKCSSSSSSEDEHSTGKNSDNDDNDDNYNKDGATNSNNKPPKKQQNATKEKGMTPKQIKLLHQEINQHRANLIKTAIALAVPEGGKESLFPTLADEAGDTAHTTNENTHNLHLPTAILPKAEQQYGTPVSKAKSYLDLSTQLTPGGDKPYVVVLLLQSGRFAGGVFTSSQQGPKCLQHKTMQKYTVRKGQGKAQATQDGRRRPKSMGSQLRRQGELQLKEDIQTLLWKDWKSFLEKASLMLISCPKTMLSTLLDKPTGTQWSSLAKSPPVLSRKDPRIRKIPITVGRPTLGSVYVVHQVLLHLSLESIAPVTAAGNTQDTRPAGTEDDEAGHSLPPCLNNKDSSPPIKKQKEKETIPMLQLHHLCQAGDHAGLLDWLENGGDSIESSINRPAEIDFMTPLHYAAASCGSSGKKNEKNSADENSSAIVPSPESAASCVYNLLVKGRAHPTVVDARLRPPYFLAGHEKVREAFRKARAVLGEDYCDWKASKVGPPLSEEALELRKAREAEKRKRKKARAKEKKAKEQALALEEAANREEEAKQQKELEANDNNMAKSLTPAAGGRTCDHCMKALRGRKNVFKRLSYEYCSTDCVSKHKRELMASAALSRFGS